MTATEESILLEHLDVSRETLDRLRVYEGLIHKWNPAINLVAKSTLEDIWNRHFIDSAAVFAVSNQTSGRWVDLGSGGGLPGLVVAILAADMAPDLKVTCIESDLRKCEFMRTVSRAVSVSVGIMTRRVEEVPPQNADVISARALAPLDKLLPLVSRHLGETGTALLHKGRHWENEVQFALENWHFSVEKCTSMTNADSVILKIGDIVSG